MPNQSDLDSRYFIDSSVYNCPFCNRRHVQYSIVEHVYFDWTDNKPCFAYITECHSCNKRSLHLTFEELNVDQVARYNGSNRWRFMIEQGPGLEKNLDSKFFFSVPTSFFVLDERVPRTLRELLSEAEGCLKSNFLTGASACARKLVYELGKLCNARGENYEDRIKSLKTLHPDVEPTFFDTLLTIQQVTSSKVHENSSDAWEAKHLQLILASLSELLYEIYVDPALQEDRRNKILALKSEVISEK